MVHEGFMHPCSVCERKKRSLMRGNSRFRFGWRDKVGKGKGERKKGGLETTEKEMEINYPG